MNAAYKGWLKYNKKQAEASDREAIRLRAIEASNQLSCHRGGITGDDGWGMIVTSTDRTSETHLPPGIAKIRKHPAAWQALNQAAK
ncbi:hypothetical protein DPH57_04800 [Massilia sp. YMA4]|nr:hypothetical protein DPH57_04800 [Massilia sp. YMA4]